ncbi:MAG: tetratricopeptide repeat protein [Pseudomonadota bacterium]
MPRYRRSILALAVGLGPALAQTPPLELRLAPAERGEYGACMLRAGREPAAAFEQALAWRDFGGAEAARHCAAVALFHLGQPAQAALRLEQLATDMPAFPPGWRAEILGQAGQAWLAARQPARAHAALGAALALAPAAVELWIDRAQAAFAAALYWEAIDDLNRALELDPDRAEALAFRAAAYRFLDSLDLALEDAERALGLAPDLAEARLERGILHRLRGNIAAARADWLAVLLIDPDSPAADAARDHIERLELKLEADPRPRPPAPRR